MSVGTRAASLEDILFRDSNIQQFYSCMFNRYTFMIQFMADVVFNCVYEYSTSKMRYNTVLYVPTDLYVTLTDSCS